jgi:transcription elongation factor Elf1
MPAPDKPPPPPNPNETWVCKCQWTNNGMRLLCRNCGAPRTAAPARISGECPSCAVTGQRSRLQEAKTPRGRAFVCPKCGDEYSDLDEQGNKGQPLRLINRTRKFVP